MPTLAADDFVANLRERRIFGRVGRGIHKPLLLMIPLIKAPSPSGERKFWEVLSHGGGTQSWAVVVAVLMGLVKPPLPDVIIFADTGYENPRVLEYLEKHMPAMAARMGVEFVVVRRAETTLDQGYSHGGIIYDHSGLPIVPMATLKGAQVGKLQKHCTSKWKTEPIANVLKHKLGAYHFRRDWICFSVDEKHRALKPAYKETAMRKYRFPLLELGI